LVLIRKWHLPDERDQQSAFSLQQKNMEKQIIQLSADG